MRILENHKRLSKHHSKTFNTKTINIQMKAFNVSSTIFNSKFTQNFSQHHRINKTLKTFSHVSSTTTSGQCFRPTPVSVTITKNIWEKNFHLILEIFHHSTKEVERKRELFVFCPVSRSFVNKESRKIRKRRKIWWKKCFCKRKGLKSGRKFRKIC